MSNKEQYKSVCEANPQIPVFLQYWWMDAVCTDWDVAIAMNGDKVAGIWPYNKEQKIGVSLRRNPSLTPYLGPHIFFPHDLKESKRESFEHETTGKLLERMPQAKVWHVALQPGQKQVGLYRANGFDVVPRQTFIMPLQEDEDALFARLHEDYRRNLRKANTEISIEHEPEMLPRLWEFQKATLDRKDVGMHFSMQQIQALFDACMQRDCTRLWVARKEGVVQAMLWHMWDGARAYYLVGSKNPDTKDNRAMTALIWNAIRESKKMEKISFDFEGSMDQGVEKFFRNFGAQRELYLTLQKNDSLIWKLKSLIR